MSAWTNITIPNRHSSLELCYDKIQSLEFENKRLHQKLDRYEVEFNNIFAAAKEYGEIDIINDKEAIKLKLVK